MGSFKIHMKASKENRKYVLYGIGEKCLLEVLPVVSSKDY